MNLENMKRALVEFEIDLTKMPLGKISKSQIQKERIQTLSCIDQDFRTLESVCK